LLIEEGAQIAKEYYVGMVIDRSRQRVALMASSEGGMDIEEVAAHSPEKIHKVWIDPVAGLTAAEADAIAKKIGIPDAAFAQARVCLQGLYRAFVEKDAMLAEINPLVLTADQRVIALDAKMNFDSNALYRHPEIVAFAIWMRRASEVEASNLISAISRSTATWLSSTVPALQWRRWISSSCTAALPPTSSMWAAARPRRRSPKPSS
jgi:succinyl-CoA synthetase beta subunit